MTGAIDFREYPDRQTASRAAADLLAETARHALETSGHASLVLSGGSTPGTCFDMLSQSALDWARVTVIPSDERWVPADDPNSNERLIRERLLRDAAAPARLLPLFRPGIEAADAPSAIRDDLEELGAPFSAVLLGMGEDGHFASLFPDFKDLEKALDPHRGDQCLLVQTAGSPYLRISLTLSALLNSSQLLLLIFGQAKRRVFQTALAGGGEFPVEALLAQDAIPATVIWAP